jgi:hypothetical protein
MQEGIAETAFFSAFWSAGMASNALAPVVPWREGKKRGQRFRR